MTMKRSAGCWQEAAIYARRGRRRGKILVLTAPEAPFRCPIRDVERHARGQLMLSLRSPTGYIHLEWQTFEPLPLPGFQVL